MDSGTLGLWWSRWQKYTAEDLLEIVGEFERHDVPLSTLVVDMDWHLIARTSFITDGPAILGTPLSFPIRKGFSKPSTPKAFTPA